MALGGKCSICNRPTLEEETCIGFPHFITDKENILWRFSDSTMHYSCLMNFSAKKPFLSKWFDYLASSESISGKKKFLFSSKTVLISERGDVLVRGMAPRLTLSPRSDFEKFCKWFLSASDGDQLNLTGGQIEMAIRFRSDGEPSLKFAKKRQHLQEFKWDLSQTELQELRIGLQRALADISAGNTRFIEGQK